MTKDKIHYENEIPFDDKPSDPHKTVLIILEGLILEDPNGEWASWRGSMEYAKEEGKILGIYGFSGLPVGI